jgi:hypothetical protein
MARFMAIAMVLAGATLIAGAEAGWAAAPGNDNFADAAVWQGFSAASQGTSYQATRETGEPVHGGLSSGSVWYRWTAPSTAHATITLNYAGADCLCEEDGNSWPAAVAVYQGSAVNSLTLVAASPDGSPLRPSLVAEFDAVANQVYMIATTNDTPDKRRNGTFVLQLNNGQLPSATVPAITVPEGTGGVHNEAIPVTLSNPNGAVVTIDYTLTGDAADVNVHSGRLTYTPGTTSQSIPVSIVTDNAFEKTERFQVRLTAGSNVVLPLQKITNNYIEDDDSPPTMSVSDAGSVAEGNAGSTPASFVVTLSNRSYLAVTVSYNTAPDNTTRDVDYTTTSGVLVFQPGELTKTVTVPVLGDTVNEANETFRFFVSPPTNAGLVDGTGVATIIDDDSGPPGIYINNRTLTEGAAGTTTMAQFTVKLSEATTHTVSVSYATRDETAKSTTGDFTATSGTLTFPPGNTARLVQIPVKGDNVDESDEQFSVLLSSVVGASYQVRIGRATIRDDDASPTVNVAGASRPEGDSGSGPVNFKLTLSAPTETTITVHYATTNASANSASAGTDYSPVSGTATFLPGETAKPVPVTVFGDVIDEDNERIALNLSAPTNATLGTASALSIIVDDDPPPTLSVNDVSTTEGNTGAHSVQFVITLSGPAGRSIDVGYTTADGSAVTPSDYTAASGVVRIPPGATSAQVLVSVIGDQVVEGNETFEFRISSARYALTDGVGVATVVDDDT